MSQYTSVLLHVLPNKTRGKHISTVGKKYKCKGKLHFSWSSDSELQMVWAIQKNILFYQISLNDPKGQSSILCFFPLDILRIYQSSDSKNTRTKTSKQKTYSLHKMKQTYKDRIKKSKLIFLLNNYLGVSKQSD